jgi:hypothetical protein
MNWAIAFALFAASVWTAHALAQSIGGNQGIGGGSGGGGTVIVGTPCTAGAIDLSLSTGCNMPQFINGVIP